MRIPKGSAAVGTTPRTPEKTGLLIRDGAVFEAFSGKKVYIETYGCRYNFGDTANMIEVLRHNGCFPVADPEQADAIIINTCTVVGPTERRMLRRLVQFRDKPLFVTGCMPMVQRETVFAVCTPTLIPPAAIREAYRRVKTVSPASVGIVQVAQGCRGTCTYCITRKARGPLKSFPEAEIREQVHAFIRAGAVEIQLTAQDVSSWGRDQGESLPRLLANVSRLPGTYRIRVGMMNPATVMDIIDDLLDAYAGDHIFRFIHLPVQSGSDPVLERMGRGYTVGDFERVVAAFRARYPGIGFATDIITGFPGETGEDFSRTLALVERVQPVKVNITRYSRRPFTGPVPGKDFPDAVKKDRSRLLHSCSERIYSAINTPYLGTIVPCLVTEKLRSGSVMARTPTYQGVVIPQDLPPGFSCDVLLKEDRKYFFTGELAS
jgi:MiaB/RimO family radical SAM methylthiotransferase